MKKLVVEYLPNENYCVGDGNVTGEVNELISRFRLVTTNKDMTYKVSSEIVISAIRLAIAEGTLNPDEVIFKSNDDIIHVTSTGNLTTWPDGFCDIAYNIHVEIISIQSKKLKERQKQKKK